MNRRNNPKRAWVISTPETDNAGIVHARDRKEAQARACKRLKVRHLPRGCSVDTLEEIE